MDLGSRIKNAFGAFRKTENSGTSGVSGTDFLKYGNRGARVMREDWSQASMSDLDFYTGYSYAAINNRANKVAQLAATNLKTEAAQAIIDKSRENDEDIIHPYLTLIDESDDFTNTEFWYDISTYLDLEGVYYLMAVRAVSPNLVGEIQYFKLLNPYNITRVKSRETMEVGGYIESENGMQREIPKEMIIEIKKLNPFNNDINFAMTDAAKDSQFTLRQASDYTRSSLKNNISAPGIISTDVLLDRENFQNFQARVVSQEKGVPLFGNGAGAIKWEAMQIDMDKAALMDVTKINRDQLFAVAGVSPSTLGIDEAGTTRDVSRTQKDKFIEDHIMPQLQLIFDALNQDYKKYYKDEWKINRYKITLDNPLTADKEGEEKDVQIAQSSYDLYSQLLVEGYEPDLAAKYAAGEISLEELGEPTLEPEMTTDEILAAAKTQLEIDQQPVDEQPEDTDEVQQNFLALNKGKGNPYRQKDGKFGTGPAGADPSRKKVKKGSNQKAIDAAKKKLASDKKAADKAKKESDANPQGADKAVDAAIAANKKLEKATSGSAVNKNVEVIRKATSDYISLNGGDPAKFKSIDENWVGNDYKVLENHVKNGDSKELKLVQQLQQAYFKKNGIKEITVYRGVYNKQAKEIKAALKKGKKVDISSDYASSWTGYDSVARDYADGAAFTAPDKITDSVMIKMTFPVKDVVYSTQVAPFFAGNTMDEFIMSSPKGYSISADDIEVIK